MKKLEINEMEVLEGEGSVCDAISGFSGGWGIGDLLVGDIAASTGVAFLIGGAVIGL